MYKYHRSYIIDHISNIIDHISNIIDHISNIINHISNIINFKSYIKYHKSCSKDQKSYIINYIHILSSFTSQNISHRSGFNFFYPTPGMKHPVGLKQGHRLTYEMGIFLTTAQLMRVQYKRM